MYIAKKLASVNAVQTLSRLNRIAAGKSDTFVLDFVNDATDIQEAFEPFFAQTAAAPTDPNVLFNLQGRIVGAAVVDATEMAAGVEAIVRGGAAGSAQLNASIDPAVMRWQGLEDESAQEDFRTALRESQRDDVADASSGDDLRGHRRLRRQDLEGRQGPPAFAASQRKP